MPDKDAEAETLALRHYEIEDGMLSIYRINGGEKPESDPYEPIKLLEVNQNTIQSGIMPLTFAASPASGVHFPSVIVEITPAEYDLIRRQELSVPNGWAIGDEYPRP